MNREVLSIDLSIIDGAYARQIVNETKSDQSKVVWGWSKDIILPALPQDVGMRSWNLMTQTRNEIAGVIENR